MKKLSPLKGGNIVMIAPSSWSDINYEIYIKSAKDFAQKLDCELIIPNNLFVQGASSYSANTPQGAAEHIISAFSQNNCKGLWAYRGGYGAFKVSLELLKKGFTANDGIIIGFSDITALHIYFNQYCNLPTIHGNVISYLTKNFDQEEYINYLSGKAKHIIWDNIKIVKSSEKDYIEGISAGGNLKVLASMVGTKMQLNGQGKIIFLEDVSEKAYSYDRSFFQLVEAGCFNGAQAIVLGNFELQETDVPLEKMFEIFASYIKIPVIYTKNFGHIEKNRILPLGAQTKIDFKNNKIEFKSIFK